MRETQEQQSREETNPSAASQGPREEGLSGRLVDGHLGVVFTFLFKKFSTKIKYYFCKNIFNQFIFWEKFVIKRGKYYRDTGGRGLRLITHWGGGNSCESFRNTFQQNGEKKGIVGGQKGVLSANDWLAGWTLEGIREQRGFFSEKVKRNICWRREDSEEGKVEDSCRSGTPWLSRGQTRGKKVWNQGFTHVSLEKPKAGSSLLLQEGGEGERGNEAERF